MSQEELQQRLEQTIKQMKKLLKSCKGEPVTALFLGPIQ